VSQNRSLVIKGDPAGKSTLLVTLQIAPRKTPIFWKAGPEPKDLLPIIIIRDFAKSLPKKLPAAEPPALGFYSHQTQAEFIRSFQTDFEMLEVERLLSFRWTG
jgi:hypothetical protein